MKIAFTNIPAGRVCRIALRAFFVLCLLYNIPGAQPRLPIDVIATVGVPATSSVCLDVNSETNFIYASGGASGGQTLTIIDGYDNSTVNTVPGSYAHVNPKTDLVYAGSLSTTILIYNATTGNYVNSINASGCTIEAYVDTGINRIWGASQCVGNDPVFVIDGSTNTLEHTIGSGGTMGWLAVNPVTHIAYIYPSGYPPKRINLSSWTAEDITSFSGAVQVVNPRTNIMYACDTNFTEVIDGGNEMQLTTLPGTGFVTVNSERGRVYIADSHSDSLRVYDAFTHKPIVIYAYPNGVHAGPIAVNTQTGSVYLLFDGTIYVINDYATSAMRFSPANLNASVNAQNVTLTWDDGGGWGTLKEYRIFQGPDSSKVTLIGATTNTSYTKYNLWGGTYYYRVSAVDTAGAESPKSFAAEAVVGESMLMTGEYLSDLNTTLLMHMNESAGSVVRDASGFSNDGQANSGVNITGGKFGLGRQFPISQLAFVSIKHSPTINLHNGCTLEAWINGGDAATQRPIIMKRSGVAGYKMYTDNGRAAFSLSDNLGYTINLVGSSMVTGSGWKHVAITGDSSLIRLFVNGVEEAETVPPPTFASPENMDSLIIGYDLMNEFNGTIDEVRLSDIKRPPEEFNLQLPPINLDTAVLGSSVAIFWENGGGTAPFRIYRIYHSNTDSNSVTYLDSSYNEFYYHSPAPSGMNFYRITAVDSTGFESTPTFAVKAFVSTSGNNPAAPTNLTIQTLTASYIELTWTDNSSNEDYFVIERKIGTSGTWQELTFVNANTQYYMDNTVVPNTLYYYRIYALSLADGASAYSGEVYGTTPGTGDTTPPQIFDNTSVPLPVISVNNGMVSTHPSITAWASDASGVSYLGIQYIRLGDQQPASIQFPTPYEISHSVTLPDSIFVNDKGQADVISYRLRAVDIFSNVSTTSWRQFTVRNESPVVSQIEQPSAANYSDAKWRAYRIVSVPFVRDDQRPSSLLPTSFGDHYEENVAYARWRFQRWNASSSQYEDYDNFQNQNAIVPGAGFFLIVKDGGQKLNGGTGRTADVEQLATVGIYLAAGWNLVGDPFDTDIPVGNLSFVSTPVDSIREVAYFSGDQNGYGGWEIGVNNARWLRPWQGLAVRVNTPGNLLFDAPGGRYGLMKQGNVSCIAEVSKSAPDDAKNWTLPVSAVRTDNGMQCKGNVIGMARDAKEGDDKYDIYMPPFVGDDNVMVYFSSPAGSMLRDVRPVNADGETWEMHVITGDAGAMVKLQFADDLKLPDPQFEVYLIDIDQHMAYDLKHRSSVEITTGDGARNFRLIAGKKSYVLQNNAGVELAPAAIRLYANYPNPFNPETVIRYTIPDASPKYNVTLKIYNMLGQEVAALVNGEQSAGYYESRWQASGYSSGVYFYQLTVTDGLTAFRDVKKMVLMK